MGFVKQVLAALLLGIFLFSAFTYAQNTASSALKTGDLKPDFDKKWQLGWSGQFVGQTYEEGKDQGGGVMITFQPHAQWNFLKDFRFYFEPRVRLSSSRMQQRFDDSPFDNYISVVDGYVGYSPISYLDLKVGALSQGFVDNSMLVSSWRTFPGSQEVVAVPLNQVKVGAKAEQVIPTSYSLNDERREVEKLPSLQTESIFVSGKHFDAIEWKANAGLFAWRNIPTKVVADSRLLGNVGDGPDIPNSRFAYRHMGWYGGGDFCYCPKQVFGFALEYDRVQNTEAPGDAADAQSWGLGPVLTFDQRVLNLRYRQFFIESDATVAAYGKSRYGYTNRIGQELAAELQFKDKGFSIFTEWVTARTINIDPNQRDLQIVRVGLETSYADF